MESVLVVTPGETIKTRVIDDRRRPGGPQFRGSVDAIRKLLENEGPRGIYRGVVPVSMKQASNSMVRFTSYSFFLDTIRSRLGQKWRNAQTMIAGSFAGVVTVYCTMPFDTLKTRLQSLQSGPENRTLLLCLQNVVREEGIKGLWRGTTPRLIRLTV